MKPKKIKGIEYYPMPDTLDGYCCVEGNTIYLSAILSKEEGKGNFRRFLDEVESKFKIVKVPTPSRRMVDILLKRGYIFKQEWFEEAGEMCDIMLKDNETKDRA